MAGTIIDIGGTQNMGYMKTLFAGLLVCFAARAEAQSWSTFGTGTWTGMSAATTTSEATPPTFGGVSLAGGPTTLGEITTLSFSYTANTSMNSGGSPRLVLEFSDGGRAELRPLTLTADALESIDGKAGPNWDISGGSCVFVYGGDWTRVQACHAGATITEIFVVNDSGWVIEGAEQVTLSAVNVNGIPFHPSKNDCKKGGFAAIGFANQGQCVSTFAR